MGGEDGVALTGPISRVFVRVLRSFKRLRRDPSNPNPICLDEPGLGLEEADCFWFWTLVAASSSMAAVLAGIWRKTAALLGVLLLNGLLVSLDGKSRNGDFLKSGES